MEKKQPTTTKPEPPLPFRHSNDFRRTYANNLQLESSAWDLVIVFGQILQNQPNEPGKTIAEQHTAVTLPWPEVKMLKYLLEVNILAHEAEDGKIFVSPRVLPELPPLPDELRTDTAAVLLHEKAKRLRHDLLNEATPTLLPLPPARSED